MTKLIITPVGRSVATSGIRPSSAHYVLEYTAHHAIDLAKLASAQAEANQPKAEREDLEFVLIHTALASPEFASKDDGGRRSLPWQISGQRDSARARRLQQFLTIRPWETAAPTANAADLACDWIAGTPIRELEDRFADLRGGSLKSFFRDVAQILFGWAGVISASIAPSLHANQRPAGLNQQDGIRDAARTIAAVARSAAMRMEVGLPTDALWMAQIVSTDGRRILAKEQIMALANASLISPSDLLDGGRTSAAIDALRASSGNGAADLVKRVKGGVEEYRRVITANARESQTRRARDNCRPLADAYYDNLGTPFEDALNAIFECVGIKVIERDEPRKTSFPDFILEVAGVGTLVMECKTSASSVDFNDATDVVRKATVNGYEGAFKVTVCKPYMSPDVARKLSKCSKLSVLNAETLGEVLVRLSNGRGSISNFGDWCAQGGYLTADTFQAYNAAR